MSAPPLDLVPAPDEPLARPRPSTVAWRGPRNPWDDPTFRPEERGESRAAQRAKVEAIQARAIAQDAGRDEGGEEGIGARLAEASQVPADTLGPSARDRLRARGDNLRAGAGRRLFDVRGEASPPDLRPCGCARRRPHRSTCRLSCSAGALAATAPAEIPAAPEATEPETKEDPVTTTTAPVEANAPAAPAAPPAPPANPAPGVRPCGCSGWGGPHSPKVCTLMLPEERATKLEAMRARARAASARAASACQKQPREPKAPAAPAQAARANAVAPIVEAAAKAVFAQPAPAPVAQSAGTAVGSITATVGAVTFAFGDPIAAAAFARALSQEGPGRG